MNIDLSGKTAIVTGSTAGIGLAIAKGLVTAGAKVVVNGRTEAAVAKAVAELAGAVSGAAIEGFAGDLGAAAGCDRLARLSTLRRAGEQSRHLRPAGFLRNTGRRMGALLRGQCHVRRAAVARVPSRHDGKTVGPRDLHLL